MPRSHRKAPAYGHHKATGQAIVRLDGKDRYLGKYGSPESHEKYARLIAEWRQLQAEAEPASTPAAYLSLTVNELLLRYLKFVQTYYVDASGNPTHEFDLMRYAVKPVKQLYGRSLAADFGPLALKAIQKHLADVDGLCRQEINRRVNRIRRVFKWAVSEELAPPSLLHALQSVAALRYGRTTAREAPPVKPVPVEDAEAVAAGLMVNAFGRWTRNQPVEGDVALNLLAMEMVAESSGAPVRVAG